MGDHGRRAARPGRTGHGGGRHVLASLLHGRRPRISPRVVKRAMSRYNAKGKVDRTTRKAVITIAILGAPLTPGDEP